MLAVTRDRAVWLTAVGTLVLRYLGATDYTLLHFHRGGGARPEMCVRVLSVACRRHIRSLHGPSSVPGNTHTGTQDQNAL